MVYLSTAIARVRYIEPVIPICARGSTTGIRWWYTLLDNILGGNNYFILGSSNIGQPVENVRDTKDENITDYIDEITESKDAHEMVKITLFPEEPDNGQDVANDTKKSNKNLKSSGVNQLLSDIC